MGKGVCVYVCACVCVSLCVRLCLHACVWHVQEGKTKNTLFKQYMGKKFASADEMQKHEDLICGRVLALQTTRKGAPGPPFQCWQKRLSRLAN